MLAIKTTINPDYRYTNFTDWMFYIERERIEATFKVLEIKKIESIYKRIKFDA